MSSLQGGVTDGEVDPNRTLRHDLRNRVNQIVGYSEMLLEEANGASDRHPFTGDLERICAVGRGLLAALEAALPLQAIASEPTPTPAAAPPILAPVWSDAVRTEINQDFGDLLIVDDVPDNREILTRRLERQGHRCTSAEGGEEALALLERQRFDVILLDLMMPRVDGFEVLSRIKSSPELRSTPVIMISAVEETESVVRCIEMGGRLSDEAFQSRTASRSRRSLST